MERGPTKREAGSNVGDVQYRGEDIPNTVANGNTL